MIRMLKAEYVACDSPKELARKIGVSYIAMRSKANSLGIVRRGREVYWTEQQDALLRQKYVDTPMSELMALLHRAPSSIYNRADALGLRKSREYLAALGKRSANHPNKLAHQFKKGHIPFNQGKEEHEFRSKEGIERCKATQFKTGHLPYNTRPIGYESIHSDGYVYIKVEGKKRMVPKHRHVWQQHHGEIPRGMCVAFRDGNRQNCDISNLMLITEAEKARRVISSLSPEQKRRRIEKSQATRNELIRKDKMRIRWGLEPKSKLIKKWYAPNESKRI